jgi:hypothetical protein
MEKKVAGALIGLFIGWIVEQAAADLLMAAGVPKHTAKVVGGVVGALVWAEAADVDRAQAY